MSAIGCSQKGEKTAVAAHDRSILLFDENGQQKDRFSTKPIDAKVG